VHTLIKCFKLLARNGVMLPLTGSVHSRNAWNTAWWCHVGWTVSFQLFTRAAPQWM